MQDRALQVRNLIDDRDEQLPAHVGGGLELGVGARAGRAQEIAAVCGLEIDADRRAARIVAALLFDAFEVAPGIDPALRR